MKITVICAAGRQGRKLVTEALNRGHKVTAVVRKGNESPVGADVIEKDLFDLTLNDLKDSDVVIDAFGAWTEDTLPQHSTSPVSYTHLDVYKRQERTLSKERLSLAQATIW